MQRTGARRWAEKSPPNIFAVPAFLRRCPDGRAIVLVRSGLDVVASLKRRGFPIGHAAAIWLVETAVSLAAAQDDRVMIVSYERLVHNPGDVLEQVQQFLGLEDHTDRMLEYHRASERTRNDPTLTPKSWKSNPLQGISTRSIGSWRQEVSVAELQVVLSTRLAPAPESAYNPAYPSLADYHGFDFNQMGEQLGYQIVDCPSAGNSECLPTDLFWSEGSLLEHLVTPERFHLSHVTTLLNHAFERQLDAGELLRLLGQSRYEFGQQRKQVEQLQQRVQQLRNELRGEMEQVKQEARQRSEEIQKHAQEVRELGNEFEQWQQRRLINRVRRLAKRVLKRIRRG